MPHVVILSGDVHYGFGAVLQYWDNSAPEAVSGTIVNFTSSSLRNPTDGVHKALLTIAYPRLFEMLHHGRLPAIEFFVWDTPSGEREALHDVFAALRSRWSHIVWAVPRLVEVMSAPTTLILPAHGWPAGSFDKYPPDHRQRLFYLRNELAEGPSPSSATPMKAITGGAAEPMHHAANISNGVPDGDADVQTRLTWRQRLMLALHGTVAVGQSGSVPQQESREYHYPDKLLAEAVRRKDLWVDRWSGSSNIIGDTNLGEVRFDWERKAAIQRLWWWRPGGGDRPTPGAIYRASLEPPNLADAPPLP
jgi:hypothetical protein